LAGYRPVSRQRLALAADQDGRFTATIHESQVEISRYPGFEDPITEGTRLLYRSPAFRAAAGIVPITTAAPASANARAVAVEVTRFGPHEGVPIQTCIGSASHKPRSGRTVGLWITVPRFASF
jgi:CO/xanthine dehydrogenase Mo-binding subunit